VCENQKYILKMSVVIKTSMPKVKLRSPKGRLQKELKEIEELEDRCQALVCICDAISLLENVLPIVIQYSHSKKK